MRPYVFRRLAIVLAVVLGLAGAPVPRTAVAEAAPAAPTGSDGDLVHGWKIRSSADTSDSGAAISQPGYSTAGWLPISRPETLMAGLLENGKYPNVFYSDRLASVPAKQFDADWWYRDDLRLQPRANQHTFLVMNGVLSRADLWINGTKIADKSRLQGAYSRFEYDVTKYVHPGDNAIALDVAKNDTSEKTGYLTMDMVDWNPKSPDGWTGLQFAPQIKQDGPVSVRNSHVVQHNAADLSGSDLTVKADVRNNTGAARTVPVSAAITRPGTNIRLAKRVTVPAGATTTVTFSPAHIDHPAVWWPRQMGGQPLYRLSTSAGGSTESHEFGIRTITSHLTKPVPGKTWGEHGYRQFVINGQPFVVRGGGWSQDMFLRYDPANVRNQLSYIANMGLNAIRFEGNFPPDDMFQQMDHMGILAMPGWQCCDKWEQESSGWNDEIKANAANQAANVAGELRDHPSVLAFYQGSDNEPDAAKEKIFTDAFRAADWQPPQIAAAEYKSSARLGASGSKEGPYNYAPPDYWWNAGSEMNEGGDFTNAGGAFGYDTETSPGNTIPTQDSLNRFLTKADQNQLWDTSSTGGMGTGPSIFHTSAYNSYTGIGRLGKYNTPLWNRYGKWTDLASYERAAQAGGYEVTRAQFEAYLGHSHDAANPSTGLIYWQMNKAWPSLQWELYGYDFDQPGVFFGAKKANEPVHVMYAYDDGSIKVANLTQRRQQGLRATAEFVDLNGKVRGTYRANVPALTGQDVRTVLTPKVPGGISKTYFLKLTLTRGGATVSRNVYWLSTKQDKIDWAKTIGEGNGATYQPDGYADLTGLRDLPPAAVRTTARTVRAGADDVTTVTIRNVSDKPTVAFQLRADVRRGAASGAPLGGDDQVLPILWSDNQLTLWPGESRTITARYAHAALRGARPAVTVAGWNVARQRAGS